MKKIFAAALALLLLCSCSQLIDIESSSDPFEESEEYEPATIPPVSDFLNEKDDFLSGYFPDISDEEPEDEVTEPVIGPEVSDRSETETTPPETSPSPEQNTEAPAEVPAVPKGCINVPFLSQEEFPSGCELVSTTMLMRFYGIEIQPEDLINGGWIDYQLLDSDQAGDLFGGDPNKIFIGDPLTKDGYGCYSRTIYNALERYFKGKFYDAAYLTGFSLSDLCLMYIDSGEPVLIWATIGMEPTDKKTPITWTISDTGEKFTWLRNEHCLLLVGYDEEYYYFNDPLVGQAVPYERKVTEQRYEEFGRQAVTMRPW